jgi:hypothetical protein
LHGDGEGAFGGYSTKQEGLCHEKSQPEEAERAFRAEEIRTA